MLVEVAATGEVETEVRIEEAATEEVLIEEITTIWRRSGYIKVYGRRSCDKK